MEHAFQFCQAVILVGGTFLIGKYRGTLMMAAAVDPKDQIVPVGAESDQLVNICSFVVCCDRRWPSTQ